MEKNNELDKTEKKGAVSRRFQEFILLLATGAGTGIAAWIYKRPEIEIAGTVIMAMLGISGVLFSIEQSVESDSFLFDNKDHLWRFTVLYLISLAGSFLFPLLPEGGWPYLAVFIGLMLFSNQRIGIFSGTVLLMTTCLLYTGQDLGQRATP